MKISKTRKAAATLLYTGGIAAFVAVAGCGGAVEQAASGWEMAAWVALAVGFLGLSAVLLHLGLEVEMPRPKKVHQPPQGAVKPPRSRRAG